MMLMMVNYGNSALNAEIRRFFREHNREAEEAVDRVTKGAYSQGRNKFSATAFVEVNRTLLANFYDKGQYKTWRGRRLLAIDGTTLQLPRTSAIKKHYGGWNPTKGGFCPKARASLLFDVLNDVVVDAQIENKSVGERKLAARHLDYLEDGDLVLLDRGYPSFWLLQMILERGGDFLARVPVKLWKFAQELVDSDRDEQVLVLPMTASSKAICKKLGLSIDDLVVRAIRIPLNTGEDEILVTSITDPAISHSVFEDLYHRRWAIEEMYKKLKARLRIENFSGKTVLSVQQDFHAGILRGNLCSLLVLQAEARAKEKSKGRKHTYKVNWTEAFRVIREDLVALLIAPTAKLLQTMLEFISDYIEIVRPGRSYPRDFSKKSNRSNFSYQW